MVRKATGRRSIHGVLVFCACGALFLGACKKDNVDPRVPPALSFITTAGYTFEDDTVAMNDTLKIRAIIDKTEDPLISLNVGRAYDGAATTTLANVSIAGNEHYEYEQQVITRGQAGSEKYTFSVLDRDGNITSKSITLTVQ